MTTAGSPSNDERTTAVEEAPSFITADVIARLGAMVSRDTAVYALAMALVFPFSMVQVAVLTRYLIPAEYGDLALLMFFAGLLTILMNVVTFQGSMIITYGIGGGEDGDDGGGFDDAGDGGFDDALESPDEIVRDKQLALSTGAFVTLAISTALAVPLMVFADSVSKILIHDSSHGGWVRLAIVSAASGAAYRFAANVLRMERQPWKFAAAAFLRPALVISIVLTLVATGHGVSGVLIGTAVGTFLTVLYCAVEARRSFRFGFRLQYARKIFVLGAPGGFMHTCMFFVHTADVFLLSRYAPASQVGLYRVASRFASIPSYFSSAYTMALPPLEKTVLFRAAYDEEGTRAMKSRLLSWFIMLVLGLVVGLSIGADLMVLLAAPSYREAAQLIPVLSVAMVLFGLFTVILRAVKIRRPIASRIVLVSLAAILMTGFSVVMIPWLGSYGAALSTITAMLIVDGILLYRATLARDPFRVQWWRVGRALLCAVAAWAVGTRLAGVAGSFHAVLGVCGIMLYPSLLVLTKAIPPDRAGLLLDIAQLVFPRRRRRLELLERIQQLPPNRRVVLEAVVRERASLEQVAVIEWISPDEACVRFVRAVSHVARVEPPPKETVEKLGHYLLMAGPVSARDDIARGLVEAGIDPYTMHQLDATMKMLVGTPRRHWRYVATHEPGAHDAAAAFGTPALERRQAAAGL
jgi:O-antigen/teichoic acid export membrane protein